MTDIVVEKCIVLIVELTRTFIYKDKQILDGTAYIYQYGLSCVSQLPQEKVNWFHICFEEFQSHPLVRTATHDLIHPHVSTWELKTVGVKREEVTPPETGKSLAPFDR